MKKAELKRYFKPIIKECVKEMLLEEGLLSNVIAEVLKGTSREVLVETKVPQSAPRPITRQPSQATVEARQELQETMKGAYGGLDLFEGTTPAPAAAQTGGSSPMAGIAPHDPGVDISGLISLTGGLWAKNAQVK